LFREVAKLRLQELKYERLPVPLKLLQLAQKSLALLVQHLRDESGRQYQCL
jgi:hypothetical protein